MAAPSAGSPAVILNATASAVQLVSKQLAGAADAYRAARLHFAGTLADLAAKEGFFAAALPAVTTLGPSQHGNAASGSQASSPAAGSAGNAASFAGTPLQALVDLLRPLITSEPIPGVQSAAVSCLGRIMQAAAQGAGTPDKKAARGRAVAECIVLGEPAHGSDAKGTVYALVAIVAGTCQISSEDPFRRGAARPHPDDHAATLVGSLAFGGTKCISLTIFYLEIPSEGISAAS